MILNNENYYSQEANQEYMSVSQYKAFMNCEAAAMASISGRYERPTTRALLVGSFVDRYFEGTLDEFMKENPVLYTRKHELRAEFKRANQIIEAVKTDPKFMDAMSGEKQRIFTFELFGVKWKAKEGTLKGGYNYAHFTIYDNVNISQERLEEIVSQYDENSIWYIRDILGKRSIAEGLVYAKFAAIAARENNPMKITVADAQAMVRNGEIQQIYIGVDFGGNGSGHSFVASAPTVGYEKLVGLISELHTEELDPEDLNKHFMEFVEKVTDLFGFITAVYCDSAEQVLIRGLRKAATQKNRGDIKIANAKKDRINDRIFCFTSLVAQGRFMYTDECETLEDALSMAVWKPGTVELERLDDGTSDIDTLDGFEYSYERDMKKYIKQM